jgi:hypothetical protein
MVRIICTESDAAMAANVGGPVTQRMKSFDVDIPELEKWLKDRPSTYMERTFTGLELLAAD